MVNRQRQGLPQEGAAFGRMSALWSISFDLGRAFVGSDSLKNVRS